MRRYSWAIVTGVCVLALVIVGVIFIPPLVENDPPPSVSEGHEVIMPGHWWKTETSKEQLSPLASLWGNDISATQLLQALWPDVLPHLPAEAADGFDKRRIFWATETYEEWQGQMICNLISVPGEAGPITCCIYLGTHESEDGTFEVARDKGFTENRTYRVSLYTSERSE